MGAWARRRARRSSASLDGASGLGDWPQYRHAHVAFAGESLVLARIDQLGGARLLRVPECRRAATSSSRRSSRRARGRWAPEALAAARIEAAYPLFGVDMTADTIPLEAGIEARAISTTKGCYVGQEVIIRVLHRGHGRVARKLVTLKLEAPGAEPRAKVFARRARGGLRHERGGLAAVRRRSRSPTCTAIWRWRVPALPSRRRRAVAASAAVR